MRLGSEEKHKSATILSCGFSQTTVLSYRKGFSQARVECLVFRLVGGSSEMTRGNLGLRCAWEVSKGLLSVS